MGLGPLKRGGGARRAPWGLGKAGLGKTAEIRVVVVARATPRLDPFNPPVTAEGGGRWAGARAFLPSLRGREKVLVPV